jgi:hypothetical protein
MSTTDELAIRVIEQGIKRLRLQDDGSIKSFRPQAITLPPTIQITTEDPDTVIEVSFRLVSTKSG